MREMSKTLACLGANVITLALLSHTALIDRTVEVARIVRRLSTTAGQISLFRASLDSVGVWGGICASAGTKMRWQARACSELLSLDIKAKKSGLEGAG
jgi:hypothetical protein